MNDTVTYWQEESTAKSSILGCKHTILEGPGFEPFPDQNILSIYSLRFNKISVLFIKKSVEDKAGSINKPGMQLTTLLSSFKLLAMGCK